MAEYKFWRRESRSMKVGKNQNKSNLILEAISGGEAARPKQMKIVMKKEDLEQLLEAIRDGRSGTRPPSLEQRLHLLRRRQILRAQAKGSRNRSGSWRPVLQSIPEEI